MNSHWTSCDFNVFVLYLSLVLIVFQGQWRARLSVNNAQHTDVLKFNDVLSGLLSMINIRDTQEEGI